MLIQNVSTAQAPQPARQASDGLPGAAIAARSSVEPVTDVAPAKDVAAQQGNPAEAAPSIAQLQNAVAATNQAMKQSNKNLEFSVDSDTHKTVVKLVDSETGDVIRQFPTEEMIAISKAVSQMQERLQQATMAKTLGTSSQGLLVKQQV